MLATENVKHTSLKGYLSALRHLQLQRMGTAPKVGDMALLQQTIKRVQSLKNIQPHVRFPITTEVLRAMQRSWSKDPYDYCNIMLWAASTICFFGFFRSGEITVPSVRKGVQVFIGATNDHLCPVAALMTYLAVRDKDMTTPLFKFQDNEPMSRDRFVREVRKALQEAGMDQSKYAGHSFRSGAATVAAACGLEDSLIKALGRWESSAYQIYVKLPRQSLVSIAAHLSKQTC